MKKSVGIAVAAAMMLVGGPAAAALVTYDISYFATGFGAGSPFRNVEVSFRLTFDNSNTIDRSSDGFENVRFSLPASYGNLQFGYYQPADVLTIASFPSFGGCLLSASEDGYCFGIDTLATTPIASDFHFIDSALGEEFWSTTSTLSVKQIGGVVPEPAGWALMTLGMIGTAAALRRRRGSIRTPAVAALAA